MKKLLLAGVLVLALCGLASAQGVAVSGANAKVEGLLGNADGETAKVVGGSVTVPLGKTFGLQIDGALGSIDEDLHGLGFHFFTRDPERYLLGVTGLTADLDGFDVHRLGFEAELYLNQLTLIGIVGQQFGDADDNAHMNIDLRYYPLDNLMFSTGGSLADKQQGRLHIGAEYQIIKGLAVYADLAIGESDYEHVMTGVRYYFGQDKSLIRRHREDDPDNNVVYGLLSSYQKSKPARSAVVVDDEPVDEGYEVSVKTPEESEFQGETGF